MASTVPLALEIDDVGKSALRKASVRLLPLIGLGYGAAILDRGNIGFAALQMNHDLHFSATMYGFGAGLFSLSYAACEIPSNLLLYRFGARRWIARIMFTWGLLAMAMMLVKTPMQFYCMRFLLGIAEAGFAPGVVYYLMQWYPGVMRARAISGFYVAAPLSAILSGLLAGPLLGLGGKLGLAGWQWLFLVEGLPPVLLSIVYFLYLPNQPSEARWLTAEEQAWLTSRIDQEMGAVRSHDGLKQTFLDPRVWQFGLLSFCLMTCIYSYVFTAPTVLQKTAHLSASTIGLIVAVTGALSALALAVNARHSDQKGERYWHMAIPVLLMAGAFAACGIARGVYIAPALALGAICFYATQGIFFAMPATFLKGKSAAAGIAAINSISILGGFVGPYWMGLTKDHTGDYRVGLVTLAGFSLVAFALTLFLRARAPRPATP